MAFYTEKSQGVMAHRMAKGSWFHPVGPASRMGLTRHGCLFSCQFWDYIAHTRISLKFYFCPHQHPHPHPDTHVSLSDHNDRTYFGFFFLKIHLAFFFTRCLAFVNPGVTSETTKPNGVPKKSCTNLTMDFSSFIHVLF